MAYCDVGNVQGQTGEIYTEDEIEAADKAIEEISDEINAALDKGGYDPVTPSAVAFRTLRHVNALGAAVTLRGGKVREKQYKDFLGKLAAGKVDLPGVGKKAPKRTTATKKDA